MASTNSNSQVRAALAAALLIALVVVVARLVGRPGSKYVGPKGAPRVLVVGDSITAMSNGNIQQALGNKVRLRFEAQWGKRSDEMRGRLEAGLDDSAGRPAAVIMNLGTNDALQHRPSAVTDYQRTFAKAQRVGCVVLVTVNVRNDPAAAVVATEIDSAIGRLAADRPNVRVADWKALVDANPGLLRDGDEVHPGPNGALVLADLYQRTLRSCPNHPIPG